MPADRTGLLQALRGERATLRAIARREGWPAALRRRLRYHSGAHDLHTGLVEAHDRIATLERQHAELTELVLARTQELAAALDARADEALRTAGALAADVRARVDQLDAATAEARLLALVDATERALAVDGTAADTLITVILPTFDRPELLPRAIASVRAQAHEAWELLVVDNGTNPGTAAAVEAAADPRVRLLSSTEPGATRARNLALQQARGELVAYLDDDNVMGALWLRAVAVSAARAPAAGAFYGARVDDKPPAPPRLVLDPISPAILRAGNVVDTSALAHRRTVPVTWPAAGLGLSDWEVVAALTGGGHEPQPIPARAVIYTTAAPGRTNAPDQTAARFAHSRAVVARLLDTNPVEG